MLDAVRSLETSMNVGSLPAPTSPSRQSDGEPRESGTRGGYVPLVVAGGGRQRPAADRGGRGHDPGARAAPDLLVRRQRGRGADRGAAADGAGQPAPAAPGRGSAAGADRPRPAGRPRQPGGADARSAADVRGRRARADVQRDARPTRVRTPRGHRPSAGRAGGRAPANRPGAPRPGGPGADGGAAGVIAAAAPGSGEPCATTWPKSKRRFEAASRMSAGSRSSCAPRRSTILG